MDPIEQQVTFSPSAAAAAPSPAESGEPLLAMLGAGDPEHVALRTPDGRTALTFAALQADVERLAGALVGGGIGAGDCVAVMVPRGVAFVPILLAVTAIGATAAPLNPAYTRDECAFYLDDLDARAGITAAGEGTALRAAAESVEIIDLESEDGQLVLKHGGRPLAASATPSSVARPNDVALLLHTSGTTSRPKQVPLLHRNLMASARAIASHYALGTDDVSFAAMPLFHVHGLVASVFAQLAAGGTVIAPDGLNARDFWSALGADGVTCSPGLPPSSRCCSTDDGPRRPHLRCVSRAPAARPSRMRWRAALRTSCPCPSSRHTG